jgi:hypothetical protein
MLDCASCGVLPCAKSVGLGERGKLHEHSDGSAFGPAIEMASRDYGFIPRRRGAG